MKDSLRKLPSIQTLLESPDALALISRYGHEEVVVTLRDRVERLREQVVSGVNISPSAFEIEEIVRGMGEQLEARRQVSLRPVVNATGIVIHTNLGRAPLAPEALIAMQMVGADYSNLELDLATGKRGSRYAHVESQICELTGAESAIVVNNCAAAVLACLCCLASGRAVVAARGELIEIGGSFRLPDVIEQSGARLKEVGATNKSRLSDYEKAIEQDTAVLLKSHTSNFRIVGFTAAPSRSELAELAEQRGLILMEDLGSGVLVDLAPYGLPDEPLVPDLIKQGVDIVTFSGDKLLGGPQAGIIAGRKKVVDQLKTHPLTRAMRIDKLSLAALEATLRLYRPPNNPIERIPVLRALAEGIDKIKARAETLARSLDNEGLTQVEIIENTAYAGGGSLPQQALPSFAVSLQAADISAQTFASRLRRAERGVLGRIKNDCLLLDMRTVRDTDLAQLVQSISEALSA
ncbi:MAG: L-seryl-tRNA(Sec) selenium transferase [Pseudomonadales bacterium]